MDVEVLRTDRVEIYPDRDGRIPRFVRSKNLGWLCHVVEDDQPTVLLKSDTSSVETAPFSEVRNWGTPEPPFGIRAIARRGLRLAIGSERFIVLFTGEIGDLDSANSELLMARMGGDLDPIALANAAYSLWQNRHAGSRAREAVTAWSKLLPPSSATVRSYRYPPEFVEQAVRNAAISDRPISAQAKELGISATTLRRWIRQHSTH